MNQASFPKPLQTAKNFVLLGEAGSGKSELAINLALWLRAEKQQAVDFFDLDMTKPLFRARDVNRLLTEQAVRVHYEEQFMDAPTMTGGVAAVLRNPAGCAVLDVGGDSIGARAIGGFAPLLNHSQTCVLYVVNSYRPWSADLQHIDGVLSEVLQASHIALDKVHFVCNPNLGVQTQAQDVLRGIADTCEMLAPHVVPTFACAQEGLWEVVRAQSTLPVLPLQLHLTYPWHQGSADAIRTPDCIGACQKPAPAGLSLPQ